MESWTFSTVISAQEVAALLGQQQVLLQLDGVDTYADVLLNDERVTETTNFHRCACCMEGAEAGWRGLSSWQHTGPVSRRAPAVLLGVWLLHQLKAAGPVPVKEGGGSVTARTAATQLMQQQQCACLG